MADTRIHIDIPASAARALGVLEDAGFEAWLVGGFVRDALRGHAGQDVDITTNARWQQVQQAFEAQGLHTFETGVAHGTLTVQVDNDVFEVTTYRTEGTYTDARHPDSVTFVDSIDDDLARRDFTINALAYHPDRGLRDPFGGIDDLQAHIIRAVGCPSERFGEDALRILRAVRFASQLGFSIEEQTAQGMRDAADGLHRIAVERISHEMEALLCGASVHDALMSYVDILGVVIPELLPMRGFDQRTPYHIYDVLEHTAYVVQYSPRNPLVRWAALLHDIGKPNVFFTDETGTGHFYGHAKTSVVMAEAVMKRLKLSPRFAHDVLLLVRYHDHTTEPVPKQVKRLLRKLDGRVDLFRAICQLQRADALAHAPGHTGRAQACDELIACLDEILAAQEPFSLKDLAIRGDDVLALGVQPGPQIGALLDACLDAVIDENVANDRDALLDFVRNTCANGM